MASTTGIEIKPDSCVLVGVRPSRAVTNVFALHLMEPAAWPAQDAAIVAALRSVRSRKRLPRRARVVIWGLPDPVTLDNPTTSMALQPFTAAGFRVESVMTPPQALAALAATRPRDAGSGAVAWLAINMNGAAIAIVRGTDLLHARSFDWLYLPGVAGSAAQLLQRYNLVAHLAPELREGIAKVRSAYGVTVETAVTCGDLPDLRSLTMPLIEELDLEVETLDSIDGLRATGRARRERFAESAPAIRLACAAVARRAVERQPSGTGVRSYALAGVTAAVALAGVGYVYWSAPTSVNESGTPAARPAAPRVSAAAGVPAHSAPVPAAPPKAVVPPPSTAVPPLSAAAAPPPRSAVSPPIRSAPSPPPPAVPASKPSPEPAAPPPSSAAVPPPRSAVSPPIRSAPSQPLPSAPAPKPSPQPAAPQSSGGSQPGRVPGAPSLGAVARETPPPRQMTRGVSPGTPQSLPPTAPAEVARIPPPVVSLSRPPAPPTNAAVRPAPTAGQQPRTRADNSVPTPELPAAAAKPGPARQADPRGRPDAVSEVPSPRVTPLPSAPQVSEASRSSVPPRSPASRQPITDPLPRIESILIDRDRRLAIVDGAIVTVGDEVGPRTVVRIEPEAVFLREPSGMEVRVRLRSGSPR